MNPSWPRGATNSQSLATKPTTAHSTAARNPPNQTAAAHRRIERAQRLTVSQPRIQPEADQNGQGRGPQTRAVPQQGAVHNCRASLGKKGNADSRATLHTRYVQRQPLTRPEPAESPQVTWGERPHHGVGDKGQAHRAVPSTQASSLRLRAA